MSLKRAYCHKCHTDNEKIRIFEVNPEASICYCPHCMAAYDPRDVIDAYKNYIQKYIDKAYKTLYEKTEFSQAYGMFAHILELDNNAIEARFGRIVCLIYLSTLRRSRFLDAKLLMKEESVLYFRKAQNYDAYIKFLKKLTIAIDEYNDNYRKKLTIRGYYYDDECIKLMFRRCKEMLEFKKYVLEECNFLLSKHEEDNDLKEIISKLETQVVEHKNEVGNKYLAVDGYAYGLAGQKDNGDAILGHESSTEQVTVKHFVRKTLGNSDKKTRIITNEVFPSYTRTYHFIKNVVPWETLTLLLTIAAAVFSFILIDKPYVIAIMILGLFALSATVLFVVLQILGNIRLGKRRHLIK